MSDIRGVTASQPFGRPARSAPPAQPDAVDTGDERIPNLSIFKKHDKAYFAMVLVPRECKWKSKSRGEAMVEAVIRPAERHDACAAMDAAQ